MTESNPDAAPTEVAQQPNADDLPEWARTAIEKANKEAAGYRAKLRETEPLAKRARELEEAQKTDLQRLTDAQEAAERRAAQAETALLRFRVAATKQLPPDLADRLRGDSEDELLEDADRLLALLPANQPSAPAFDGGPRGVVTSGDADFNTAFRRAAGKK